VRERAHGCGTGLGRPACGSDCQNAMATGFCSRVGRAGSAVVESDTASISACGVTLQRQQLLLKQATCCNETRKLPDVMSKGNYGC
jgi:hypothetical protein